MKFQKVLIVLGISACLLTTQLRGTYGLEEKESKSSVCQTEEVNKAEARSESMEEGKSEMDSEQSNRDAGAEESEESTENVEETAEIDESEGSDKAEETGKSDETKESDEPEASDETEESENTEKSEETENTEETEESEETENSKESGETEESEETGENQGAAEEKTEEAIIQKPQNTVSQKPRPQAVNVWKPATVLPSGSSIHTGNQYDISKTFLDKREKVKYNVDMPLEGLPSFITQEMVVGALKCQDETGYPASVLIAQIIQESGFGTYGPNGDKGQGLSYLAYQYNNLFGIKGMGTAGSVNMSTGEQTADGSSYMTTAGFRVYHTYTECIEDRTKLLQEVYGDLIDGVTDANTFAVRIGRRWATDINYSRSLIYHMRKYDLYRLDDMTLDDFKDMMGIFANPCPGSVVTSKFGRRTAPIAGATTYHRGIDLGTGEYNIPTYAAESGKVVFAGDAGACGLMITIEHENGLVTKYMHHDKIYVKEGQTVEKGQQIGLTGSTGNSTGNHLHFQVEINRVAIDPSVFLGVE